MSMRLMVSSINKINAAAQEFVAMMGDRKVFALYGNMGVGKTTFIKAVCRVLGVGDMVSSPTFAIVNEYQTSQGKPVYHFDFYRIKRLQEALDIGCQDYFYSGNLCFIEWPEMIEPLLPYDFVRVTMEVTPDEMRRISL